MKKSKKEESHDSCLATCILTGVLAIIMGIGIGFLVFREKKPSWEPHKNEHVHVIKGFNKGCIGTIIDRGWGQYMVRCAPFDYVYVDKDEMIPIPVKESCEKDE